MRKGHDQAYAHEGHKFLSVLVVPFFDNLTLDEKWEMIPPEYRTFKN